MSKDEEFLVSLCWEVECESPLEIRHSDGSFATEQAAQMVLDYLKEEEKELWDEIRNA